MSDFTIADVLVWARTKPADEAYDFYDASVCAIAQFGEATGRQRLIDLSDLTAGDEAAGLPLGLSDAVIGGDWTFGALVERLERLCPETRVIASNWLTIDAYLIDVERVSA
jgi:hypothetical protein